MPKEFFGSGEEESKKSGKNKKGLGEEIEIAIKVNKRVLERTFYITTIIILIIVIVFLIVYNNCIIPKTTGGAVETFTESVENKTNITKPAAKVQETPKENKTPEKVITPTKTEKTEVDAEIIFNKEDIETEGTHPSIKVTSVKYKIKNKGAKFIAKVQLRWYDIDDGDALKDKIRATDEFVVNEEAIVTRTMESFDSIFLSSINNEEWFVLALYNSKDDKVIDTAMINYSP